MTATRPLTDQERDLLAARAVDPRSFASFLAVAWGMGFGTLFAAFLVLAVPLVLAGVDFTRWPAKDLTILGVVAVFAFWTAIAARNHRRHRVRRAPLEAMLHADLTGGVAEIERHRAVEAIRAIAPEHGERAYFVRLADDRVLFVGYWHPAGDAPPGTLEAGNFPSTEFELARGPASRLVLGAIGCGEPLATSQSFELGRDMLEGEGLPEAGGWVETPWAAIQATFG
ncbi:MAG: hypothetical protein IT515_19285 [Burkholderiales bacterium]|nr:hypothetical protein [Burkholderiales bacterium]